MLKCLLHKLSITDDISVTILHTQECMTESLMPLRGSDRNYEILQPSGLWDFFFL